MMTTLPSTVTEGALRRIVLIDFDWQDADLLPLLLQRPGVMVRLVAGERMEEAGLRMAEVCGLPRTLDLADLTREIFDLALLSDRSPRRARVESLLEALRTPCLSPREFLDGRESQAGDRPAPEARSGDLPPGPVSPEPASREPLPAEPAPGEPVSQEPTPPQPVPGEPPQGPSPIPPPEAPVENRPNAQDIETIVERALQVIAAAAPAARPPASAAGPGRTLQSLRDFPSREDRAALEEALVQLVANTGAFGAELHAGRASAMQLVAQVGTHDPLLEGMVGLALQLNLPQIIKGLSSPNEGRLWGAWPFRTIQHRGVLAASAIDPQGGVSPWEKMVDEMRERWDRHDRESSVRSFPLLPGQERAWLDRRDFGARLELAVERNRYDGLPFALHRLEFPAPPAAVERLCEGLPQLLRGSDFLCHLPPRHVLLLTAVPSDAYTHVRRRLLAAWEQAWRECGESPPAPPITDLRAEMAGPEDAEGFLASAEAWLEGSAP